MPMDLPTLHKNADRVSGIFNALSIFILIVGGLTALAVLAGGILASTGAETPVVTVLGAIVGALLVGVYTAITWAGVQLAAIVAGYIKLRTSPGVIAGG